MGSSIEGSSEPKQPRSDSRDRGRRNSDSVKPFADSLPTAKGGIDDFIQITRSPDKYISSRDLSGRRRDVSSGSSSGQSSSTEVAGPAYARTDRTPDPFASQSEEKSAIRMQDLQGETRMSRILREQEKERCELQKRQNDRYKQNIRRRSIAGLPKVKRNNELDRMEQLELREKQKEQLELFENKIQQPQKEARSELQAIQEARYKQDQQARRIAGLPERDTELDRREQLELREKQIQQLQEEGMLQPFGEYYGKRELYERLDLQDEQEQRTEHDQDKEMMERSNLLDSQIMRSRAERREKRMQYWQERLEQGVEEGQNRQIEPQIHYITRLRRRTVMDAVQSMPIWREPNVDEPFTKLIKEENPKKPGWNKQAAKVLAAYEEVYEIEGDGVNAKLQSAGGDLINISQHLGAIYDEFRPGGSIYEQRLHEIETQEMQARGNQSLEA